MSDVEQNSAAFIKWIGGIVASIATAVGIYYLTRPPAPAPTPVVTQTAFPTVGLSGVVADANTHQLIHDAVVIVKLGDQSVQQSTDPSGAYSVVLPGVGTVETMGTVSTTAAGYTPYTNTVPLNPSNDNYAEISLESTTPPPAAAPSTPGNAPTAPLNPGITIKKLPTHFIKPAIKYAANLKP